MNRHQQEQELFKKTAELLADDKITPEQACSFIENLCDAGMIAEDILDPEEREQEQQKGFNEIAGVYADYKISKKEACELFVEWVNEWKRRIE
jgi:superfamily I DNA/RNA helicase